MHICIRYYHPDQIRTTDPAMDAFRPFRSPHRCTVTRSGVDVGRSIADSKLGKHMRPMHEQPCTRSLMC